ncbi:MAG TPA: radical SAM protein [Candidatus Binataceae bacterium]|nr:radical SAM protein [Candidatus Binataceae bacterium]
MTPSLSLLVAEAEPYAESRRGVEFVEMGAKQILNRCSNPQMPFAWTINPYRGCEFGCVYCYARYTHEFLELRDPMDFERRIFIKRKAAEVLERTLARTPIGRDEIAIGTATDPYQPAERTFELTRSMLEVFARVGGLRLSITTKSNLVVRDLDVLKKIAERSAVSVNFSLITLNRRLQRVLEPRAPRPELRLRALSELTAGGIRCKILMMPMIPGLTDGPASVESIIAAARRHGAADVHSRSLFLKPSAAKRFLPFIEEHFPQLAEQMKQRYGASTYGPRAYDQQLEALVDRLKRKYGYQSSRERQPTPPTPNRPATQLSLGLGLV